MKIKGIQGQTPLRTQQKSQARLEKLLAQMASGKRISSASDDPAGMAIASRMTGEMRGLNQGMRNLSDGISYTQTAEAGLGSMSDALGRMRELAVQAGNGTLNAADRKIIQQEMDQLAQGISDTARSTVFNGKRPLMGDGLQIGTGQGSPIDIPGFNGEADQLGQGATVEGGAIDASGLQAGELSINGVDIRATQAGDDALSTAHPEGSAIAVAAAINEATAHTGVTAEAQAAEVEGGDVQGGSLGDADTLEINGVSIAAEVEADDAGGALTDAINAASDETGVTASLNANGVLLLRSADGRNIDLQLGGNAGTITGLSAGTTTGTVTLSSADAIEIDGADPGDAGLSAGITGRSKATSVGRIDVTTPQGANDALASIDRALEEVLGQRSRLGAVHNRMSAGIDQMSRAYVHQAEARSRIEDADYARLSTEKAKQLILGQAGVSMQAQANVSAHIAAQLLTV
ncbi:MAG: flagellin [Bradymonadia bacterium]